MADTRCACRLGAGCSHPATQEDLLCDVCREGIHLSDISMVPSPHTRTTDFPI